MTKLQGSWVWYELMTPDPAGAKAFYDAVIGWAMQPGTPETGDYGFIANADGGMTGGLLKLSQDMTDHGARPCWLGYIGVDDVDASVAAIEAAGGKSLMPARDVPMAGRIAMVADADGVPFYIMTPTPPPGGGESTCFSAMPHPGRCGWNELLAGSFDGAVSFYTGQFGWTLPDAMDMGPMGKYQFIAHDGTTVGAIMAKPDAVPAPLWCHYFWVESIAAAKERVTANGGHIVNGPHEVPGPLWIIQGVDPQGALFSLVGNP
ncbi:VOC family protein [Novosphingobium ginsenosidimutans]|uniref:VOC family protein n=1 Tax=Novosphingobium ginsenosidimutans TaxID=1176536 RepID=A0A5B8S7E0_9SPHN|nr:VOC family protein [Novosphingobium ginsenosidimutans]QEA17323.1 VOC family protein [Novosphingobium ginsenosidimutans]